MSLGREVGGGLLITDATISRGVNVSTAGPEESQDGSHEIFPPTESASVEDTREEFNVFGFGD